MADHTIRKGNLEICPDDNSLKIRINPNLFGAEAMRAASYRHLNEAFISFDSTDQDDILVEICAKDSKADLEDLGKRFNSNLIDCAVQSFQKKRSEELKQSVIAQAKKKEMHKEVGFSDLGFDAIEANLRDLEKESLEDPLGISIPWGDTEKIAKKQSLSDTIISIDQIKVK